MSHQPDGGLKVIAIISAFNEEDVIAQVVRDYLEQGAFVYLLDDGSTDGTVKAVEPLVGQGLIAIESLPKTVGPGGQPAMSWDRILRRKQELSLQLDGDWFIHADADELRESPWQDRTLVQGIELVDQLGFNAIRFALFNFHPTDDSFQAGDDLREKFSHYARLEALDRVQIKAWKRTGALIDLVTEGGHEAKFPGRRVFPISFLLRHYPIRSQAHGERKVFQERKARFLAEERDRQWHRQYDPFQPGARFIRDASTLIRFDAALTRAQLYLNGIEEHVADLFGAKLANAVEAYDGIRLEHAEFVAGRGAVDREAERLSREYAVMTASRDQLSRQIDHLCRELTVSSERWSRELAAVMAERDSQGREAGRLGREYAAMTASRDELERALRELSVSSERARSGYATVVAERDQLARELAALTASRDESARDAKRLGQEYAGMTASRDQLARTAEQASREHAALIADRDQLAREVERLNGEYATMTASRDQCARDSERLSGEYAAMTASRDEMAAVAEQLGREQAALSREYAAMTASRDQLARVAEQLGQQQDARELRSQVVREAGPDDHAYAAWLREIAPTGEELDRLREQLGGASYQPIISLLVIDAERAREMLSRQIYGRWELCPVDASRGLVAALNDALALATGEFIAWIDGADELEPQALAEVVLALQERDVDVVYSDEDKLSPSGTPHSPFFKPDWSPELLESASYLGHLTVLRRTLTDGFRDGFDGGEDYDLVLRATEKARRIHHLPKVLYHQRSAPRASGEGGRQALRAALERRGERGDVEHAPNRPGWYRTRREVPGAPRVTVIIPTRDQTDLLEQCLDSLARTSHKFLDVLVVDNGSVAAPMRRLLGRFRRRSVRVVRDELPFNFSRINNSAVALTSTPFVLFLNDDTRVVDPDWLTAMLEHAQRPEVGAVGARLLHEDGSLQHGGVALGCGAAALDGIAAHLGRGQQLESFPLVHATRNLSTVTAACLLVRRSVFDEVGGFDTALPVTYNDVDLCLKIRQCGYRNVYTPWATLIHHESATRGPGGGAEEPQLMIERWGPELLSDPYYSPNLSLQDSRARLRFRAERDRVAAELARRVEARRSSASRSAPRLT